MNSVDKKAILLSGIDKRLTVTYREDAMLCTVTIRCDTEVSYYNPLTGYKATLSPGTELSFDCLLRQNCRNEVAISGLFSQIGGFECLSNKRSRLPVRVPFGVLETSDTITLLASRAVYLMLNQATNLDSTDGACWSTAERRRQYRLMGVTIRKSRKRKEVSESREATKR